MHHQNGAGCFLHRLIGADMIKVPVSIDNLFDFIAIAFSKVQNSRALFTRINNHGLTGSLTRDHKTVDLQRANTQLMYKKVFSHLYYPVPLPLSGRVS